MIVMLSLQGQEPYFAPWPFFWTILEFLSQIKKPGVMIASPDLVF